MTRVVAIIPARGGSKGFPRKNLAPLCGKPLVAWSIEQARRARSIDQVWVSSDSDEILEVAERFGARSVKRPAHLATDDATSESAWLHALDHIEASEGPVDLVVGMQATSPIREPSDLDSAVALFRDQRYDSLFSCCEFEDFFLWKSLPDGRAVGDNHDPINRKLRQHIEKRYLENGSFYLFTPILLRTQGNRLGGRIGPFVMARHKMFQVDSLQDLILCEAIMRGYGLDRLP